MKCDCIKILRYNTGSEKQVFNMFKDKFDAVLFNANIVVHSGGAIADVVSTYKNQYIIDPQTHIFQHEADALKSNTTNEMKKSVEKYLNEMPEVLRDIILVDKRAVTHEDINSNIVELCEKIYFLQTQYISKFSKEKEYQKYLDFAQVSIQPRLVIAPYFMLKDKYTADENKKWIELNSNCIQNFITTVDGNNEIAAQLVLEKKTLTYRGMIDVILKNYCVEGFSYIFIWVDDFYSFFATPEERKAFSELIQGFNKIGKKPIIAYGGYDAILMCHKDSPNKIYGVSQSIGYGEFRSITPVGSGLPTNKYYFYPLHLRMNFSQASNILEENGYFNKRKSDIEHANDYYDEICRCKQCHDIIKDDINNFNEYNEAVPFEINTKRGVIKRNRPTTNAQRLAAIHFMYCKVNEWSSLNKKNFGVLIQELKDGYAKYYKESEKNIVDWCDLFGK